LFYGLALGVGSTAFCTPTKSKYADGILVRLLKVSPRKLLCIPALDVALIVATVPLKFFETTSRVTTSGKAKASATDA
jgi:hypothetical protein